MQAVSLKADIFRSLLRQTHSAGCATAAVPSWSSYQLSTPTGDVSARRNDSSQWSLTLPKGSQPAILEDRRWYRSRVCFSERSVFGSTCRPICDLLAFDGPLMPAELNGDRNLVLPESVTFRHFRLLVTRSYDAGSAAPVVTEIFFPGPLQCAEGVFITATPGNGVNSTLC